MFSSPSLGFSFVDLFLQADWIVKSVMVGLIAASVWSWSIIFSKIALLRRLHYQANEAISSFSEGVLEKMEARVVNAGAFGNLMAITSQEWKRMKGFSSIEQRQLALQRLEHLMTIHVEHHREETAVHMGILASMGSTAPFIGLFGTVWGIMNSFQSIAVSKETHLAIVAPGIAEALFATAIGLVVAIPAVVAYNRLNLSIQSYNLRLENFAYQLLAYCERY